MIAAAMRAYPLHYYNDHGWLKVPAPLWIAFAIGLQHLWFFAPTLHKVLPELGELQLDLWLLGSDLLVVLVLLSIGHRMPTGGLAFMRKIWQAGWFLLVIAYMVAIVGFTYRHWEIISWPGHRLHNWSLFVLAVNGLVLMYLLFSRHARDVFSFSPPQEGADAQSPGEQFESVPQEAQKPVMGREPAGVAMRKRQAEQLLAKYPVGPELSEPEQGARSRLAQDLENSLLWHDLGIFCLGQNRLEQATDFVRHASLIDGANPLYLRNLAELCRRSGLLQEALDAALAAIRLSPQDPEAHYNLGVIYMTANRFAQAAQSYQQALALKPDHVGARQNLAAITAPPQPPSATPSPTA